MKETYAEEVKGTNIRIASDDQLVWSIKFIRMDTGEGIGNVEHAHIEVVPGREIWATLTLAHVDSENHRLWRESVTFNSPKIDLQAGVHEAYEGDVPAEYYEDIKRRNSDHKE